MTDYMVSANEARDLLDGYEALKSSPECSGACARAAAPDLARTVVALHERVAAVEAERDGALAHAETLTQALRAAQRERDALRAIVEGRTTPPTDSDLAVHAAHGGLWRTRYTLGDPELAGDGVDADRAERVRDEQVRTGGVYLWWALDSHGRPCAWPEVPRG